MGTARIDELQKKFDENPRRYFAPLANEYRKLGDRAQAIALCRTHLPNQPGHISGHIVLGQALFESGDLAEARHSFESALDLDPENLIALRHLGDISRAQGAPSAARGWYQRVLDADPRNDEIAQLLRAVNAEAALPDDFATRPTPVRGVPVLTEPVIAPPASVSSEPLTVSDAFADLDEAAAYVVPRKTAEQKWVIHEPEAAEPTYSHAEVASAAETESVGEYVINEHPAALPPFGDDMLIDEVEKAVAHDDDWFAEEPTPIVADQVSYIAGPAYDETPQRNETDFPQFSIVDDWGAPASGEGAAEVETGEPLAGRSSDGTASAAEAEEESFATAAGAAMWPVNLSTSLDMDPGSLLAGDTGLTDEAGGADVVEMSVEGAGATAGFQDEALPDIESGRTIEAEMPAPEFTPYVSAERRSIDPATAELIDLEIEEALAPEGEVADAADAAGVLDEFLDESPVAADTPIGRTPESTALPAEEPPAGFVTATMAELYLQQGFNEEALAIYRQLAIASPEDQEVQQRIASLESGESAPITHPPVVDAPAPDAPSVRSFFARFAMRVPHAASLPTSAAAAEAEPPIATLGGAASIDEGLTQPDERPSVLNDVFGSVVPPVDHQAADALASAFESRPAPAAGGELSLGALFGEVEASSDEAVTSSAGDHDTAAPRAASGEQPEVESHADIEQFTAWLDALKKK